MTKLSKSLLTIAIATLLSISFMPTLVHAETSDKGDTIDIQDFYITALQTAYNKYSDFKINPKQAKTPENYFDSKIMSNAMKILSEEYKVNDDYMLNIIFSARSKSVLYQAQYERKMKQLDSLYSNLNN